MSVRIKKKITYFSNGKWIKRKRCRKDGVKDNPVVILRDLLKKSGYIFDKNMEKDLGKLYLYADEKVRRINKKE